MRESAESGGGKGAIGGALAVLAAVGAMVAKVGDDLGRVAGTGGRLASEVAAGGAVDDVARIGVPGAVLHEAALGDDVARIGQLGDDVVRGVSHEGALGDDVGMLGDLLGVGVDAASLVGVNDDDALAPLRTLDPAARSARPVLAWGVPSAEAAPQLVLVTPDRPVDPVVAACAAQGRWCVVEPLGKEDRAAILARFEALAGWWDREHPSDAEWVATAGARMPEGVGAGWLVGGDRWGIAHR